MSTTQTPTPVAEPAGSQKRRILLNLTMAEAQMLRLVIGNGWGDGDFAEWLGSKRDASTCRRAMDKLDAAMRKPLNRK